VDREERYNDWLKIRKMVSQNGTGVAAFLIREAQTPLEVLVLLGL
jgi:hypothetical protein